MALSRATAPLKAWPHYLRKTFITGMVLVSIMSVSACGKKPPHVDPPSDDAPVFPQIYPDPSTNK